MARYQITAPDGLSYEITAPDTANEQEVMSYAQANYKTPEIDQPPAPPREEEGPGFVSRAASSVAGAARGVGEFLGMEKITQPFMQAAAYGLAESPAEKEAVGLPSYGEVARAGLHAGALALPYGTIAKGVTGLTAKALPQIAAKGAGLATAGGLGGYMVETGEKLAEEKPIGEAFTPGLTTAAGAAIGPAIAVGAKAVSGAYKGAKWVGKQFPTAKNIETQAAEELSKRVRTPAEIEAATREARKVSEATGVSFRRGQIMDDAEALQIERDLMVAPDSTMSKMERIRRENNEKKLYDYYQNKVLKGKSGISEVNKVAANIQTKLVENSKKASAALDAENEAQKLWVEKGREKLGKDVAGYQGKLAELQAAIPTAEEAQKIGGKAYAMAKEAAEESQKLVKKAYEDIPDVKNIPSDEITSAINTFKQEVGEGKDFSQYPWNIIKRMEEMTTKPGGKQTIYDEMGLSQTIDMPQSTKPVDLKNLINFDQWINRLYGETERGADKAFDRALGILKSAVNKSMDVAEGEMSNGAVEVYRAARQAAKGHAEKYYQGTVASMLRRGARGEETRIPMSSMAAQVFREGKGAPEAADDFFRAIGGDKTQAREAVKDYAQYKFLKDIGDKPITFERLKSWVFKHRDSLQKFGLESEFTDVAKTTKALKGALNKSAAFEKDALVKAAEKGSKTSVALEKAIGAEKAFAISPLAKMLESDPDKAMKAIYTGKNLRDSIMTTKDVVNILESTGNGMAVEGYKNAFAEHLRRESQRQLETLTGANKTYLNAIKRINGQYGGAIRELYKDDPARLAAMRNIQKALEISSREAAPLISGSATASNWSGYLRRVAGMIPGGGKAVAIANTINVFGNHTRQEVNEYLTAAAFNPDFAKTIQDAVAERISKETFSSKLAAQLSRMGGVPRFPGDILYEEGKPFAASAKAKLSEQRGSR